MAVFCCIKEALPHRSTLFPYTTLFRSEINLIDGGASIGTTAIADGDGIIHNDGGTMKVTSAATFKTYFQTGISSAADEIGRAHV